MLKKLVKYGNSHALVLDKALLELLSIEEGSVVKLRTDGTSLIITAQHIAPQEKITPTITQQDTMKEVINANFTKNYGSPEKGYSHINELREVSKRYAQALKKLETPEIKHALEEIEQRFNGDRTNPDYIKTVMALHQHYVPELAQMDKEIQTISKKYASENFNADKENTGKFILSIDAFKKVHEKYQHVQDQVAKLSNENTDYIHESVLLAEKYHATKNSPEYIQEYTELIAKYIPEYADYQKELKMAGNLFKKDQQ